MIPYPISALKDVTVLVTRPVEQAESLCRRIDALQGTAISFPTIAIEALKPTPPEPCDWVIFVSVNAVRFGLPYLQLNDSIRIGAIGKATAAALAAHSIRVDAIPESGTTSENLLNHPAFGTIASQRVLIVKGVGGREHLQDELMKRGAQVTTLEVYRRVMPQVDAGVIRELEQRWSEDRIDIVTFTSLETLDNLRSMLSAAGQSRLASTPFVAVSERVASAARERGLLGECALARGADDESIVGAIVAWHARAR